MKNFKLEPLTKLCQKKLFISFSLHVLCFQPAFLFAARARWKLLRKSRKVRERAAWKALGALPLPSKRSEFAKNEYHENEHPPCLPACAWLFPRGKSGRSVASVCCFPFPLSVCEFPTFFFVRIYFSCVYGRLCPSISAAFGFSEDRGRNGNANK